LIHETIRAEGESELNRTKTALLISAVAAGVTIGFSLVAQAAAIRLAGYAMAHPGQFLGRRMCKKPLTSSARALV
jgi:formate/nitrite transporter FocA (FNT family)